MVRSEAIDVRPSRPLRPLFVFALILGLAPVLLALGAVATALWTGAQDVNRAAYIRENVRLLAQVPRFPGARVVAVSQRPTYAAHELCCGSFISGYITEVTYVSPPRTAADDVTQFYARRLPFLGWSTNGSGSYPAGWPRVLKGKENVTNIDFRLGDSGLSVNLIPFIGGNRIVRGGRFVIAVDHRGFRPLS